MIEAARKLQPTEYDAEALARTFACRTPDKMRWQLQWGTLYQCNGCSCSCGTTGRKELFMVKFQQVQQELAL